MNTIDTAFQISFLIQKGVVVLEMDDGVLFARPTSEKEKQQGRNIQNDENVQAILSFNCAKWQVNMESNEENETFGVAICCFLLFDRNPSNATA